MSSFAGFRFSPEAITVAVCWYLRYGLSYRDIEELLPNGAFGPQVHVKGILGGTEEAGRHVGYLTKYQA